MTKKESETSPVVGVVAIVLMSIAVFFFVCDRDTEKVDKKIGESEAFVVSQTYIKNMLVAPSTADFPWSARGSWTLNDSTFVISSYVDAQNYYGAQVRTNYKCKLRYKGGDWLYMKNWELLDIETW